MCPVKTGHTTIYNEKPLGQHYLSTTGTKLLSTIFGKWSNIYSMYLFINKGHHNYRVDLGAPYFSEKTHLTHN